MGKIAIVLTGLLMAVAAPPPPAAAQGAGDLVKEMIGEWELSNAARSKTCVISLKGESVPRGLRLELERGCAEALPFMKDVVAWNVRGLDLVRLIDQRGQAVIDLSEVESGILEGQRSGEGIYLLQNLAAARAASRSTDQMIGNWSVVRGSGRAICGLTLTNTEAGPDAFEVFVNPPCETIVASFAPRQWRLERGELQLMSASGEIWHFEADDNAQWRRVPDSADPILLVRP
ncbi:MAG: peptidase [Xanthobacteraceae bacterium]|nr:MAG: peptidase [Xanthobacteraceae bacterium]